MSEKSKFYIGQIVEHRRFSYRGVIYRVDIEFALSDSWYEAMAITRPPKDQPWYSILVDNSQHTTYVAERNLMLSRDKSKLAHPLLEFYFEGFNGYEFKSRPMN